MTRTFLLSILLILSTTLFSQKNKHSKKPDQWDSYIENWMKKDSVPGLYLIIAKEGQVLKEKGYGLANIETKNPPARATTFEIGAISKMFTALSICMLAEQGKINLDSSITKYIDSLPQGWQLVTPRNLLYHSCGLNPIHYDESLLKGPSGYRYSTRDQFRFFRVQRQYALAGTATFYTNSAYFLLGMIIQNTSGKSYNEFIRANVFDKAGMKNSFFINEEKNSAEPAKGYTIESGNWKPWTLKQDIQTLDCNSYNGIVSTPEDMLLFDNALRNNSLVKKETYQQMLEPLVMPDGKPASSGRSNWGMGSLQRDIGGYRCSYHLSETGTGFFRFPKESLTVIVLTNLGNGNDFIKNKGTDMNGYGLKLADEIVNYYLIKE